MTNVPWSLLALIVIPLITQAEEQHLESLKVGDTVYRNVTVTSVTSTDLYFTHAEGIGNAKLESLTPDRQRQFKFNAATAAAVERQRKEGATAYSRVVQQEREADLQRKEAARRARQRAQQQKAALMAQSGALVNQEAPKLVVEKWIKPAPDLTGKFVLIDFWATWCGPCRESILQLNALHREYSDRLVIIGLSSESEAVVRSFTDPDIEYPCAIDTRGRTAGKVGVVAIPHALLIDPSGIVRYQGHPILLKESLVQEIIKKFGS